MASKNRQAALPPHLRRLANRPNAKTDAEIKAEVDAIQPCIRCPDHGSALKHGHCNDFQRCQATYPTHDGEFEADQLWWGFSEGKVPDQADLTRKKCNDLLEAAKACILFKPDGAALDIQNFPNEAAKQKENFKVALNDGGEKALVTKGWLERAVEVSLAPETEDEHVQKADAAKDAEKARLKELKKNEIAFFKSSSVREMPNPKQTRDTSVIGQKDARYDAQSKGFPVEPSNFKGTEPEQASLDAVRNEFARPDKTFDVYTNHFMLEIPEDVRVYEYQISSPAVEWDKATGNKRKVLINSLINNNEELRENATYIASDGRDKIIAVKELSFVKEAKMVKVPSFKAGSPQEPTKLELKMELTKTHTLNELVEHVEGRAIMYEENGAIEALNIIIAKAVSSGGRDTFQLGRTNKFFFRPGWSHLPGHNSPSSDGLIAIRGYTCSLRPSMGYVTLNINTVASAFYNAQLVQDFLPRFGAFPEKGIQDVNINRERKKNLRHANEYLKGLRVYVNFSRKQANEDPSIDEPKRRTKTIYEVAGYADQVKFEKDGKGIYVLEHMQQKYKVPESDSREVAINVGSDTNPKYYLASQLDVLSDQLYRDKVPAHLLPGMIDFARRTPQENRNAILGEGMHSLGLKDNTFSDMLDVVNIRVNTNMMSIPARRVPTPTILYKNRSLATGHESGHWSTMNMNYVDLTSTYRKGGKGQVHVFKVNESKYTNKDRQLLVENLINLSSLNGLQQLNLQGTTVLEPNETTWTHDYLAGRISPLIGKVHLFALFLPGKDAKNARRHASFMSVCEQVFGVLGVVLCEESMMNSMSKGKQLQKRSLGGHFGNVTMKLNLRLGNFNHKLDPKHLARLSNPDDCMILGADVTHPGGAVKGTPSIAAVVGSIDKTFAPFRGSMRYQKGHQEEIEQMEQMVTERLEHWTDKNGGKLPGRIMFYRDGVGESYYARIRNTEIQSIRQAWTAAYKKRNLPIPAKGLLITAVIVAKRHNTRFYPKDRTSGPQGKHGNVPPGTVVDSSITSPYFMDFFVQSHNPLEGSGKPAHYFVLENGMGFTEKELQDLTDHLCYTYERSACAVSYAPPAYYADRLCERGRQYLKKFFDGDDELKKLAQQDPSPIPRMVAEAWNKGQHNSPNPWHPKLDHTMFWM